MSTIIRGAELSNFKTVAIALGKAKKADRDGNINRYAVITVQDVDSPADKGKVFFFEDELETELGAGFNLIDILKNFAKPDPKRAGSLLVDIRAAKESKEFDYEGKSVIAPYLSWPGGMFEQYKLRKGPCYANDIDGNLIKDGDDQPVVKDRIVVFTQVKFIKPDADGNMVTTYFKKFDLHTQGSKLERRFYKKAVNETVNTAAEEKESTAEDGTSELDF